ncbi:MAG: MtaA/CmuA family methyltransferase [Pirellulales bacterium]|nr:MtaA/CmuA family methyltransferase [Pirellulales bacterium]HJN66070.1 MtaA/CmuA family methyltransferase [Pirellulales bacterium]
MKPREIFLRSLRRQATPRVAVGSATSIVTTDLMDEVGVAFPEAHRDSETMACLASAGHTVLGYDNVMPLFSVWHEASALGCRVDWGTKGRMPDGRPAYATVTDDIAIPKDLLERLGCAVPLEALRLLKDRIGDEVAILGKVFGPWTLAYHLFGVQEFLIATLLEPDTVRRVMRKLVEVTFSFANAQIEAGADALCLADHCTRDLCSPESYRDFVAEIHQECHETICCPLVLHICGDTADRLKYIRHTGIECFHIDSKVPSMAEARKLAGEEMALMGSISNLNTIRGGTLESVSSDVREKVRIGIDIIGPECAVPLDAPFENLKEITRIARTLSTDQVATTDGEDTPVEL